MLPDRDLDDLLGEIVDRLAALSGRISDLERLEQLAQGDWTDYSALSTIVGWSSFTVKSIGYITVGKLVCVSFYLAGTSDNPAITFTLPYISSNAFAMRFECATLAVNSGAAAATPGRATLPNNSNTVTVYKDYTGAAWTASGTKQIIGQLWYVAA